MSRRKAAALGLLCLGALTGCGAGQQAQTYKTHTYEFVNADQGDIAIRGLAIDTDASGLAKGGTARVTGSFVSQGKTDDSLVSATSPDASGVQSEGSSAIAVPAGRRASTWALVLTGLTRDIRPGNYVELTLNFQQAGRTTVRVPVRSPQSYEGGATAGPSAAPTSTP